jgi:hypothetical protein
MGLALSSLSAFCQTDDHRAHAAGTVKSEPIASYWRRANCNLALMSLIFATPSCEHGAPISASRLRLVIPKPLQFDALII